MSDEYTDEERLSDLTQAVQIFSEFPKVQMDTEDADFLIRMAHEAIANRRLH